MSNPKPALVILGAIINQISRFSAMLFLLLLTTSCGGGAKREIEIELLDWPDAIMEIVESQGFRMGEPEHEVYLGRGWDIIEQDEHGRFFRWATGDTVEIRIPVVEPRDIGCRLRWLSAPLAEKEMQGVVLLLNGRELDRVSMRSRRLSWHELLLPADGLRRGWNTLQMIPSTSARTADDDRPLRFLMVEAKWGQAQFPTVTPEQSRGQMKHWVESVKRSGGYVATANNSVQFNVAVPKGSTISASFYSGGGQETGAGATVTIIGETLDGQEEVVYRADVKAGATPTEIRADIRHDLSGLAIKAAPGMGGHGVAIGSLSVASRRSITHGPTVFLITVDGLRYDAVRPEGSTVQRLPFFSWLLQNAFFLEKAFTPANMTLPIYSSLMTGSYPFVHGVVDNEHGLSSSVGVVAEDLATMGYRCIAIVANSLLRPERARLERGFSRFVYPEKERVTAEKQSSHMVEVLLSEWPYLSPGFVWLHYNDLTSPTSVPERFISQIERSEYAGDDDAWSAEQQYYGALGYVDSTLNAVRILTTATGLWPEAVWLVLGTHGLSLGEREAWFLHDNLYQESIHVPVIARVPQVSESGGIVRGTVNLVDVRPTVCELTGSAASPEVNGMSFVPLLRGTEQTRAVKHTTFCEAGDEVAVIRWPFKLIQAHNIEDALSSLPASRVLFHLENDPNETADLSDDYFSEATDLVGEWINLVSETIPRYRPVPFRVE